ncbi:MBL fold metallo-hydrolase [Dictyobacter formicarum]|uniref:MBL fold metallo-hydrolase n=1 Tax=Dictyobacter formicarum TaxID=2778368 RepID=UPI0019159928|nr:MBL fold metallo-hydrolase [Dictyobacter formicarum]
MSNWPNGDHWWGNQVFYPDANIIATGKTYADLLKHVDVSKEKVQLSIENDIRNLEAKLAQEPDVDKRRSQAHEIATRREILTAIPIFEPTIPHLTLEHQLTFHGSKRTVEVLTYGGGHTRSDAFLYLPDDQILFMGDLLFVHTHPWIGDGDPEEWVHILQQVEQLNFTVAVPGHGPVGGRSDMALNRHYLTALVVLVEECMSKGLPLEEATKTTLPEPFNSWEGAEIFD